MRQWVIILCVVWLLRAADCVCASSFVLPSLADATAKASCVIVGVVTERAPAPADAPRGQWVLLTVDVEERLKGEADRRIQVLVDAGDPQGMRSPFAPLPAKAEGSRLLLFVQASTRPGARIAPLRFGVADGGVKDLFMLGQHADSVPLPEVRAIVAQVSLVHSAIDGAEPATAMAACRTALFSEHGEVVRFGAQQAQLLRILPQLVPDIEAALRRVGPQSAAHGVLQGFLRDAQRRAPAERRQ